MDDHATCGGEEEEKKDGEEEIQPGLDSRP